MVRRVRRCCRWALLWAVVLYAPAALADDRLLTADPAVPAVDALDRTVAWITGSGRLAVIPPAGGRPRLSALPRGVEFNLGLDERGRVVLPVWRCPSRGPCRVWTHDVVSRRRGRPRTSVPRGCHRISVAVWRTRTVMALYCGSRRVPGWANRLVIVDRGRTRTMKLGLGIVYTDVRGDVVVGFGGDFGGEIQLLAHGTRRCLRRIDYGTREDAGSYDLSSMNIGSAGVTWLADVSFYPDLELVVRSARIGPGCTINVRGYPKPWGPKYHDTHNGRVVSVARDRGAIYSAIQGWGIVRTDAGQPTDLFSRPVTR